MCAFIQGGFKGPWMAAEGGIHHGWLQKEGYTALFKWSTNGVQMDIPSVSCIVNVKCNWIAMWLSNTVNG